MISIKEFYLVLKENKKEKKRLVDSEFVETCHEQVTNSLISIFTVFARITMQISNSGKNSAFVMGPVLYTVTL